MNVATIGERLQKVAVAVGAEAHPFGSGADDAAAQVAGGGTPDEEGWADTWRTVIHGDPKAANIFLRANITAGNDEAGWEVALIDFQWTGFGQGLTLVHISVQPEPFSDTKYTLCSSQNPLNLSAHPLKNHLAHPLFYRKR